jgi:hypothetical protein
MNCMNILDEMKLIIVSYLYGKYNIIGKDFVTKSSRLDFFGYSPHQIGRCLSSLRKDGIVEKVIRVHSPAVWETRFDTVE